MFLNVTLWWIYQKSLSWDESRASFFSVGSQRVSSFGGSRGFILAVLAFQPRAVREWRDHQGMADGNMIISLLPPRRTILDKSPKMVGAVDKGDGQNGSLKSRDSSGSTSNLN